MMQTYKITNSIFIRYLGLMAVIIFGVASILGSGGGDGGSGGTGGGELSYVVYSLQDAAQDQTDLYAVREDGSGKVQISNHTDADEEFEVVAPGGRIIYSATTKATGNIDIYIVNKDGSGRRALADNAISEYFKALTPDGRVVFALEGALYSISVDGGAAVTVADDPVVTIIFAGIAPDGRVIYEKSRDVFIVNNDSSGSPVALTTEPDNEEFIGVVGDRAIYYRFLDATFQYDLYSVLLDGTDTQPLATDPNNSDFFHGVSPSGRIVTSTYVNSNDRDLYSINADGSGWLPLATTVGTSEQFQGISPANMLVYTAIDNLYAVNVIDGDGAVQLTSSPERETFKAATRDRRIVYTHQVLSDQYDLYIVGDDGLGRTLLAAESNVFHSFAGFAVNGDIVYGRSAGKGATIGDIYIIQPDGSGRRALASDPSLGEFSRQITANDRVVYAVDDGIDLDLYSVKVDGSGRVPLANSSNLEKFSAVVDLN